MAIKTFPALWWNYLHITDLNYSHEGEGMMYSWTRWNEVRSEPVMKFDCSSDTTSIDKIISVNLVMSVRYGYGVLNRIYPINRPVSSGCTWNSYGAGNWAVGGAQAVPQDRSGTPLGVKSLAQGDQEITIAPADYINWRSGSAPLIMVADSDADYQTRIWTEAAEGQWGPYIQVEYIPPTRAMYILGG